MNKNNQLHLVNIDAKISYCLLNNVNFNTYLNNWFKTGKSYIQQNSDNDITNFLFNDKLNEYMMILIIHNENNELINTNYITSFIKKNYEILLFNNEIPKKFQMFEIFTNVWNHFNISYINRIQYLLSFNLNIKSNLYDKFYNKFSLGYISQCFYNKSFSFIKTISSKQPNRKILNIVDNEFRRQKIDITNYWTDLLIITYNIYKKLSTKEFKKFIEYSSEIIDKKTPILTIIDKFVPDNFKKKILIKDEYIDCIHYKVLSKFENKIEEYKKIFELKDNICKYCNHELLCQHYFSDESIIEEYIKEDFGIITVKMCKLCGKIFNDIEFKNKKEESLEHQIVNIINQLIENKVLSLNQYFQFTPLIIKFFYEQLHNITANSIEKDDDKSVSFIILCFIFSFIKYLYQFNNITLFISFINKKQSIPEIFYNNFSPLINFFNMKGTKLDNIVNNYFVSNFYNKLSSTMKIEFDKEIQSLNAMVGIKNIKENIISKIMSFYTIYYIYDHLLLNKMLKFINNLSINILTSDKIFNLISNEFKEYLKDKNYITHITKLNDKFDKTIKFNKNNIKFIGEIKQLTKIEKKKNIIKEYKFEFLTKYQLNKYQIEEIEFYLKYPSKYIDIKNFLYNILLKINELQSKKINIVYDDIDLLYDEFVNFTKKINNIDHIKYINEYITKMILTMRTFDINPTLLITKKENIVKDTYANISDDFSISDD